MQKYIILGNWTEEGRKTINEVPKRLEKNKKLIEELNGSFNIVFTFGEYDFIVTVEVPDEETMAKFLLKLNGTQNFKTKTLRAWDETEFAKMVSEV